MKVIDGIARARLGASAQKGACEIRGTRRLAVPACAFAVNPAVGELAVHLRSPLEAV